MGACKVKVCRICFALDCQLHLLHENVKLYKGYEAVTGLMLEHEEDLPPYLCTNCSNQLMNSAHFRHRTLQAHLRLLDILKNHDRISVESIQAVIRTTQGDTDIEHTEEGRTFRDFQINVKHEDIPVDATATKLGDDIKIEYDPDDVGVANDLVGDEAVVAPYVMETNVTIKENVCDEASVNDNVDVSKLGTDFTMAESTGNAIPNQDKQENVVIVKIDVHHRYSQVSQISDPGKASQISEGKRKSLERRKTTAVRMREYRARKKNRIQTTNDNSSSVHQGDGIFPADDNLNNSHRIVVPCQDINATCTNIQTDNMPCVKIRIQSTGDAPSIHHQDDMLQADNLSNSQQIAALPCQDINATPRNATDRVPCIKIRIESTSDNSSVVHHQDIILHADNLNDSHELAPLPCQDKATRGKSAAERMREYRARKKNRIKSISDTPVHQDDDTLQADDNLNNSHEFVGLQSQDIKATCRKTTADRMGSAEPEKDRELAIRRKIPAVRMLNRRRRVVESAFVRE